MLFITSASVYLCVCGCVWYASAVSDSLRRPRMYDFAFDDCYLSLIGKRHVFYILKNNNPNKVQGDTHHKKTCHMVRKNWQLLPKGSCKNVVIWLYKINHRMLHRSHNEAHKATQRVVTDGELCRKSCVWKLYIKVTAQFIHWQNMTKPIIKCCKKCLKLQRSFRKT